MGDTSHPLPSRCFQAFSLTCFHLLLVLRSGDDVQYNTWFNAYVLLNYMYLISHSDSLAQIGLLERLRDNF